MLFDIGVMEMLKEAYIDYLVDKHEDEVLRGYKNEQSTKRD